MACPPAFDSDKLTAVARVLWNASPRQAYLRFRRMIESRTVSRPTWHEIRQGPLAGLRLLLSSQRSEEFRQMLDGRFDAFLYKAIEQYLPMQSKVVWDVGTHIGYHALGFANLVGDAGHVVAFEPNHANVVRLEKNIENNQAIRNRVTVMKVALTNEDGVAHFRMFPNPDDPRSTGGHLTSLLAPLEDVAYRNFEEVEIQTARADTIIDEGDVPVPDLVKIDVEGGEVDVLRGAVHLLASQQPLLLIEVHSVRAMFGVCELLQEHRYEIEIIEDGMTSVSRAFLVAKPSADEP